MRTRLLVVCSALFVALIAFGPTPASACGGYGYGYVGMAMGTVAAAQATDTRTTGQPMPMLRRPTMPVRLTRTTRRAIMPEDGAMALELTMVGEVVVAGSPRAARPDYAIHQLADVACCMIDKRTRPTSG